MCKMFRFKYFRPCFRNKSSIIVGLPELYISVFTGDAEETESLLMGGAHVDERTLHFFNATPLHVAADCIDDQQAVIVELLLKFGADINAVDANGNTALHIALLRNADVSRNIVRILINNGCDVNHCNNDNCTPLFYACESADSGNVTLLRKLLFLGAKDETIDRNGNTLLMRLFVEHFETCAKFLIKHNICTRVKQRQDNTLLHLAISYATYETVDLILKLGVDICAINNNGEQALHIACLSGGFYSVQYLMDCYVNFNSIIGFMAEHSSCFKVIITKLIWWNSAKLYVLNQSAVHDKVCSMLGISADNHLKKALGVFVEQVEKLKKTWIAETSVTLYDFLIRDDNEVVKLLENDTIVQYLSTFIEVYIPVPIYVVEYCDSPLGNHRALLERYRRTVCEYSYYRGNIYCRFQLGLIRKSLMDKCKMLSEHCNVKVLPLPCLELILFQLANSDLSSFIEAFEYCDEEDNAVHKLDKDVERLCKVK